MSPPPQWGKIITSSPEGLAEAASDSWLVVECVPESLALKKKVIKRLDEVAGPETIVASNSSSYTITEILQDLELEHANRFVSLHSCK